MSSYAVWVTPQALAEIRDLPGHMRQRVRRAVDGLAVEPRPSLSSVLGAHETQSQVRRLRLDRWRIVYTVDDVERAIDVLAVRKRPPYDYKDLERLLTCGM